MNNNGREIISLTEEDGKEIDFEYIGTVEYEGNEYYALFRLKIIRKALISSCVLKMQAMAI